MITAKMSGDGAYFLHARITPPRRTRSVLSRPRLNQLATGVLTRLLTVVSAPPGYGKTTLGLAWSDELTGVGAAVGWLSLDASDNDATQLLFHMAAALGRVGLPGLTIPADLLAPRSLADPLSLVEALLAAVAGHAGELVLFLDDCHCVVEPQADALVLLFCQRAPPNLHLVLLSRGDLTPAFLSRVAPDDLAQIGPAMLSFDAAETAQLASKLRGDVFTPADLAALHLSTAGWPAALRASLLSVGSQPVPAGGVRIPATTRPISALIEDVLASLPPDLVEGMARVAVVDRFCVPLLETLTGCADAQALLDDMLQRQLFVTSCDADQQWFSFHALFREQLLRRLAADHGDGAAELRRRAADWFARNDLWGEAVGQALAAGDHAKALLWIEGCAMRLLQAGDLLTLLSWLCQLRSQSMAFPLRLKLAIAWAHAYAMHTQECTRILAEVEAVLAQDTGPGAAELQAEVLALHAVLRNFADDEEASIELAQRCLALAPRNAWVLNIAYNAQATAYMRSARWKEFYSLPPVVDDIVDGRVTSRSAFSHSCRLCYRGVAAYCQGRLDQAAAELQRAMGFSGASIQDHGLVVRADRSGWVLPAVFLAQVRYEQGLLPEADRLLSACMSLVPLVGTGDYAVATHLTAIRLAHDRGDLVRIATLLDEFDSAAEVRGWARLKTQSLLERLRLSLLAGSAAEAAACRAKLQGLLREAGGAISDLSGAYVARDAFLGDAWFETCCGNPAGFIDGLRRRAASAEKLGLPLEAARCQASLAFALLRCADEAGSGGAMKRACELAAAAGAQRVLFDLPFTKCAVLRRLKATLPLLPAGAATARFVGRLIDLHAATPDAMHDLAIPAGAVEHLSGREHHVLKLVAQGQRNKEIARQLGLAPSTVKYHLRSVFSKLGVSNRAQAVAFARELAPGRRSA